MFPKTQVIVNPESNQGKTGKRWKNIKEALKSYLKDFKCEFTEKPFQATEISRAAIKDGSELIVGVGGDGTINEIANGFYENQTIINPKASLGIIPSGTGSDFSKSLNIPSGLKNAIRITTQTSSTLIDIGRVKYRTPSGKEEEKFFLNIADFGIGGEVVKKVNEARMKRKTSSYLRCLASTLFKYKNKKLKIKIDDIEIPMHEYLLGAIANGKVFGKGMKIAPHAELNDGLFDFVLVKGMKILELCRNSWKLFLGTHLSHPKISLTLGRRIEAIPDDDEEDILLEFDGEQLGKLPATFEIVPQSFLVKSNL